MHVTLSNMSLPEESPSAVIREVADKAGGPSGVRAAASGEEVKTDEYIKVPEAVDGLGQVLLVPQPR